MSKFLVGRQPIFDAKLAVEAYELLFCDSTSSRPSADAMTADILVHTGLDVGLPGLVGNKLAFVNAARSYLVGEHEVPFPADRTVIDVPQDIARDEEVVAGCRCLVERGYQLAVEADEDHLDDPLLELVSMVKIDIFGLEPALLPRDVVRPSSRRVRLLARRVETREQLTACQCIGFDLFQGYLLSRPEIIEGRAISPSRLTCLRIMEKLCDPETSAEDIADIVKTDASLSYRFLRLASAGAAAGLSRRLSSVREGVVLVGQRRLRDWVMLMLLADMHEGSDEQLNIAMTRAKMAELMAEQIYPPMAEPAFTAGLVSALDLLLSMPLAEVLKSVSLSVDLEDALLGNRGLLGSIIWDVLEWETGGAGPLRSGVGMMDVAEAYQHALAWSTDVCGALADAAQGVGGR